MPPLSISQLDERLRSLAAQRGAVAFGIADLTCVNTSDFLLPAHTLDRLSRGLSVAMPISPAVLASIAGQPNLLYEHHYRQVNFALDRLALELTNQLLAAGFAALPIPASQLVDWKSQRGHLSHKRVAVAAGIGWLGRNNLLVLSTHGAQVRLVTVLTDAPLSAGSPMNPSCGQCRACLAVCPAGAIGETPADFRHLACLEQLKEFQRRRLVNQYICGLCVRVCGGSAASARNGSPDQPRA